MMESRKPKRKADDPGALHTCRACAPALAAGVIPEIDPEAAAPMQKAGPAPSAMTGTSSFVQDFRFGLDGAVPVRDPRIGRQIDRTSSV